jgi:DNA polymerase-3 subunit delta
MKIKPFQADAFAAKPDPAVRAVLVYGPDRGLVRERLGKLIRSVVADPEDPFRVAELTGEQAKADPAAVADEAAAMAFGGGRRVVVVRGCGDDALPALDNWLNDPQGDSLVLAEAGDLESRSKLRQRFEKADAAAAVACYRDGQSDLSGLIRAHLKGHGLEVERDALGYLASQLGGDRAVTRSELDKLALYVGVHTGGGAGRVGLADAEACVGDSAALSLEDVALATADGDLSALERAYGRAMAEGLNPVSALRAAANHFKRLHQVADAGDVEQAAGRLRPPVFWKIKSRFVAQARAWRPGEIGRALELLLEAEARCKTTGVPTEAIGARALMGVAARSPLRRRGRR